ncbi:hypothetical protein O6P43_008490 [Quillaja saponaria]|uniref:Uncharacterized protein n=1 Tax=Quillaja saponaria TaxID=32244 RepID=A0AAD7M5C5_QUISA|nr:hypothetical protein O6P43_008490 [Quillaja saponaria]
MASAYKNRITTHRYNSPVLPRSPNILSVPALLRLAGAASSVPPPPSVKLAPVWVSLAFLSSALPAHNQLPPPPSSPPSTVSLVVFLFVLFVSVPAASFPFHHLPSWILQAFLAGRHASSPLHCLLLLLQLLMALQQNYPNPLHHYVNIPIAIVGISHF